MLFWTPPAFLIIFGNLGVLLFGLGFLLVNVFEVMPVGDATGAVFVRLAGLGIAITDVAYRRAKNLSVMSLQASTIFFVIPSWVVGLVLLIFARPLLEL